MDRREFLFITGFGVVAGFCGEAFGAADRPNVLVIVTDQQSATMLGCAGNEWVKTPAMDSLMTKGMRFERAYATNPVCMPSRFSLLTGFYPSAIGVRFNSESSKRTEEFVNETLGWAFRRAGYETVYGGKVHLHGAMGRINKCGFDVLTGDQRDELADKCAEFLGQKHEKPFLLYASFINPHDICYQGLFANGDMQHALNRIEGKKLREAEKFPEGVGQKEFYDKYCPPLPVNHEVGDDEPEAIKFSVKQRPFKKFMRDNWGGEEWRLHRWAYAKLTEIVDKQIGRVLDALRQSGLEDNTIVVFTSDHGDMDSAHKLEHKSMTYEESARIPMLVQYRPVTKGGHVDRENLVSNGLDLFPTLCDLAGIKMPKKLPGRSLMPLLSGEKSVDWRKYLMIETEFGWGVVGDRYKYTLYDKVGAEETLFDIRADAGEMRNLAGIKEYEGVLKRMRIALREELPLHRVDIAGSVLAVLGG